MSITVTVADIEVYAGVPKVLDIYVVDADAKPEPLGSATLLWEAQQYGSAKITKSSAQGSITVVDANLGHCQLKIAGSDTQSLTGVLVHEFTIVDASGDPHLGFRGTLTIL